MRSYEKNISSPSDYYVYSPSQTAMTTFFFPICAGHFFYNAGYQLHRTNYNSFLIMYIVSGNLTLEYEHGQTNAAADSFVFLDCHYPHAYYSKDGWESYWLHFDGPMAKQFASLIISNFGHVFTLKDNKPALSIIKSIYELLRSGQPVHEVVVSKQINDWFTEVLTDSALSSFSPSTLMLTKNSIVYINEHFTEELTIDFLAKLSTFSPYHFIRVFKKETGFTPHKYIQNLRIQTAKYLLKTTQLSIKDISIRTGFSCESVFCSCFKLNTGMSPTQLRENFL